MNVYVDLIAAAAEGSEAVPLFLRRELPYVWLDAYAAMTPQRRLNVSVVTRGTFDYFYDDQDTLVAIGEIPDALNLESRLVAVIGVSAPDSRSRDDARLRGWVGPTSDVYGGAWDKGHSIAHSIGGAVAGSELNVFVQRRDVNRGWSSAGRTYRAMERYCATHPGTLCWSRPAYTDDSAMPLEIEFGLLKDDGQLWVETFANAWEEGEYTRWRGRRRSRVMAPRR